MLANNGSDQNSLYVQGSGKLVKLGSGTLTFAEDFYENGFTGDIEVVEGRVALNHPIAEGQSVYVHDGAGYTVYADTDRARITYETEPLDKSRYDVNADAPNGIALAGSPYFYDTVLGGPTSAKTVTVSGTVTHGEVSDDAPFTLHGNEEGSTTVLDNTGLEALPLLLDGAGGRQWHVVPEEDPGDGDTVLLTTCDKRLATSGEGREGRTLAVLVSTSDERLATSDLRGLRGSVPRACEGPSLARRQNSRRSPS